MIMAAGRLSQLMATSLTAIILAVIRQVMKMAATTMKRCENLVSTNIHRRVEVTQC
jgi:hypothetical protein